MEPNITEEELKSLKLFSYYAQSYGIKSGVITTNYEDCRVTYLSELHDPRGSRAELYDRIDKTLTNIIENNKFSRYVDDCDNFSIINLYFDFIERTLEITISEYIKTVNDRSDDVNVDELDDELIDEFNSFFKTIEESGYSEDEVFFSGSGDDGDINSSTNNLINIPKKIMEYFYNWLNNFYVGWELNEGSQGMFIINSEERRLYLEFGENDEKETSHDINFIVNF
jgi:hypothetical protein